MDLPTAIQPTLTALFIIAFWSVIFYRENVLFRWAEFTITGVMMAYAVLIGTNAIGKVLAPWGQGQSFSLIIPILIAVLAYTQFTPSLRWLAPYPVAFLFGATLGGAIAAHPSVSLFAQINGLIIPFAGTSVDIIQAILRLIVVATSLLYFTFTRAHTGVLGGTTKFGRYMIMAAFGIMFASGLARASNNILYILSFLLKNWLGIVP